MPSPAYEPYCGLPAERESYSYGDHADRQQLLALLEVYGLSRRDQEDQLLDRIESAQIPVSNIQQVIANYDICERNRDEILKILRERDDISKALSLSVVPIRKVFGGSQQPVVQLVCDPDSDGDSQLFAVIQYNGSVESGRALMKAFRVDWWSKQSSDMRRAIRFGMDIV